MKKDIEIADFDDVYIAVIQEWNSEFEWYDWIAYLINDSEKNIENVIVVSKGYGTITKTGKDVKTSMMRHGMREVESKSYAKIELIHEDSLELTNEFWVTFFKDNKLYDKKFIFRKNTINDKALRPIPHVNLKGVIAN